jgi:hypothetical protein
VSTPDVALVDAIDERGFGGRAIGTLNMGGIGHPTLGRGTPLHSPVLLVLREQGDAWKIASLRLWRSPSPPPDSRIAGLIEVRVVE